MVHDTVVLTGRLMKHVLRSPDTVITVAFTPIAILLLFRYVLGGSIRTGGSNYTNYVLPGILLIAIASGVGYTALRLHQDASAGITARLRTMPISRTAVLWAHVVTSLVSAAVTTLIIVGVGFLTGFRPSAGVVAWFAVAGILALFTLTSTWLAVLAGLTARTVEGATALSYPLVFLPFLSSAFVPTEPMPAAVRWFTEHQPVTSVVETLRGFVEGVPVGDDVVIALAWIVGIGVLAYLSAAKVCTRA